MSGKLHFHAPIGELVTFIGQLLIFLRYVVNLLIGKVLKPLRPCRRYKITYDASYTHLGTHVGKEGRERNSEEGKGRFSGQKRGLVKDIVQCIIRIQFGADRRDRLMHRRLWPAWTTGVWSRRAYRPPAGDKRRSTHHFYEGYHLYNRPLLIPTYSLLPASQPGRQPWA